MVQPEVRRVKGRLLGRTMSETRWVALEIACTLVLPTVVLLFLSSPERLGPIGALGLGLSFPAGFAIASMVREGTPSALSAISFVSVLVTGGLSLFEVPPETFALKEGAMGMLLGAACLGSAFTRWSLVPVVLDRALDPVATREALAASGGGQAFATAGRRATIAVGVLMMLSSVGAYALARLVVRSPGGTEAFTAELGAYTAWSFPAITLPSLLLSVLVLRQMLSAVENAAGRPLDELLRPLRDGD